MRGSKRYLSVLGTSSCASSICGWTLWLTRGENKGKDWVEKALGWSVELLERPRKAVPEEVLM